MNREEIDKKYRDMIKENTKEYKKDYFDMKEKAKNSTAKYKGEPIPFLYMPKFYTDKDVENFKNITTTISNILKKVVDEFIEDENYRTKFGFSDWINELILLPTKYNSPFPMARFDIFYNYDESFKFCEINTDGSSAMNEEKELSSIFLDTKAAKEFKKEFDFSPFELFESWVDELLNIYSENHDKGNPSIAIVDFVNKSSMDEFVEFRDRFRKRGLWCEIVSPDEIEYNEDGYLYFDNKKIDIVYRRLVTRDLIDNKEKIEDFIKGIRKGKTEIIGPIKSQIAHNKIVFKILQEEDTLEFLNNEEKEFIKKHIPYTKELILDNLDVDEIIENKNDYIIKPMDLYASKGVYAGKEYNSNEWEKLVKQNDNNNYLIQEYFNPPETLMIDFDGEKLERNFKNITGLYVYNEKFYGIYSRVGKKAIISGIHDGYTLPTFYVRK